MKTLTVIPPAHPLKGAVSPPGSKSITNRVLLLAGLAKGESRLTGALKSDDTRYMAEALRAMGVAVTEPDDTSFVVNSPGRLQPPEGPLFLGNAGTATRFLTAALALGHGRYVVDGDPHMRKRPIQPLVDALQRLGVDISAPTGCPPVTINAKGRFTANHVTIDAGLSSQYVSALLMAAPLAGEGSLCAGKAACRGRGARSSSATIRSVIGARPVCSVLVASTGGAAAGDATAGEDSGSC